MPSKTIRDIDFSGPQTRAIGGRLRAAQSNEAPSGYEFSGVAVPWDTQIEIWGIREEFAPGSIEPHPDGVIVCWRHDDPIGKITNYADAPTGWDVDGRITPGTARGDEAAALLADGVLKKLSIRFQPLEWEVDETGDQPLIRYTRALVEEVSLVPFPAYQTAAISEVRQEPTPMPPTDTIAPEDLAEVREELTTVTRRLDLVESAGAGRAAEEHRDMFRSVGHLLKAIAANDEQAISAYNNAFTRDYAGGTTADTILRDGWVGNLVELIKKRRPVLSTFATGTLPSEGMTVEYAVLKGDTTSVDVQEAEGDDLDFGKVSIETKNAPVVTIGGWSELSRQAIERSSIGVLDLTWEALAEKYGQRSEARARAALEAALAWDGTGGDPAGLAEVEGDLTDQDGVVAAVMDLAEHFDDVGRSLDGIYLDRGSLLALYAVQADDRILQISGAPTDKVGTISVRTFSGEVAGLQFKLLPNADPGTIVAYDATAIKTLEAPGAPFRLQDGNIVNLTQAFSLYGYLSSYVQKPAGLVKVVPELSTTTTTTTAAG